MHATRAGFAFLCARTADGGLFGNSGWLSCWRAGLWSWLNGTLDHQRRALLSSTVAEQKPYKQEASDDDNALQPFLP
jgi:hypothetical protein